jgi:hypothetical protein
MHTGITTETPKNLLLDAGALYKNYGEVDQAILGATKGGASFVVTRDVRDMSESIDGAKGPVKGFRRIIKETAQIKATLMEMTTANLTAALAGTAAEDYLGNKVSIDAEGVGVGDAADTTFNLDHTNVVAGTLKVYVNDVLKASPADYAVDLATGVITFTVAPTLGHVITASYEYTAGATKTHDKITSTGIIADADYLTNIAIVGTISGSGEPFIGIIKNALGDGNLDIKTADKDEAGVEAQFTAHYDPADLDDVPWEIRNPVRP